MEVLEHLGGDAFEDKMLDTSMAHALGLHPHLEDDLLADLEQAPLLPTQDGARTFSDYDWEATQTYPIYSDCAGQLSMWTWDLKDWKETDKENVAEPEETPVDQQQQEEKQQEAAGTEAETPDISIPEDKAPEGETVEPEISSEAPTNETDTQAEKVEALPLIRQPIHNRDALVNSMVCPSDRVDDLWKHKSALDKWFDANQSHLYRRARLNVFPENTHPRLTGFHNRLGLKLKEVVEGTEILSRLLKAEDGAVLDLLGSKNIWPHFICKYLHQSQSQCQTTPSKKVPIYAVMTKSALDEQQESPGDTAHHRHRPHLLESYRVIPDLVVEDEVLEPEIIDKILEYLRTNNVKVNLVVADGSVRISECWPRVCVDCCIADYHPITKEHLENYHELYNARCVLSQVVLALKALQPGGDLVLKVSVLYALRQVFDVMYVVKPTRSRPVNSERFITCLTYNCEDKTAFLERIYEAFDVWSSKKADVGTHCPASIIPIPLIEQDSLFMSSTKDMVTELCARQSTALQAVCSECERLQANKHTLGEVPGFKQRGRGSYRGSERGGDHQYKNHPTHHQHRHPGARPPHFQHHPRRPFRRSHLDQEGRREDGDIEAKLSGDSSAQYRHGLKQHYHYQANRRQGKFGQSENQNDYFRTEDVGQAAQGSEYAQHHAAETDLKDEKKDVLGRMLSSIGVGNVHFQDSPSSRYSRPQWPHDGYRLNRKKPHFRHPVSQKHPGSVESVDQETKPTPELAASLVVSNSSQDSEKAKEILMIL